MNRQFRYLPLIIILMIACLQAKGQTNGKVWKKRVIRTINMQIPEDKKTHHLKSAGNDTTITELLVNAAGAGKLTVYSNIDDNFSTKQSATEVKDMLSPKKDTVTMTDPVSGKEVMKIVSMDINYDAIQKFRILEEWTYNPGTGKTDIQITGIAPVKDVFVGDNLRGSMAIFWVRYQDALPVIAHYEQSHPTNTFSSHIWDDYFLSDVKPTESK